MTEEARKLLEKGERALNAAETLLRAGDAEFAAGRLLDGRIWEELPLNKQKASRY